MFWGGNIITAWIIFAGKNMLGINVNMSECEYAMADLFTGTS